MNMHTMTDYMMHINVVDGRSVCALIWLDPERPIPRASTIILDQSRHGREDLLITGARFGVRLAGVASACLDVIRGEGLHVIEQRPGEPPQSFRLHWQ
jgi:hypothetical protein